MASMHDYPRRNRGGPFGHNYDEPTFSLEPIDIHLKYMHVYTFQAKIDLTASVGAAYLKSLG